MTLDNMTGITEGSYTGFCKRQLITCNRVKECNGVCPFEDALKHADKEQSFGQMAERPKGEWIKKQVFNPEHDKYVPLIECSVCGYEPYYGGSESKFNYCANCGARMKGGEDE